ncbi:MAG: restriction endonuclease subunit R [Chitinophagaceae bacterium]|nr:MAG: restriction endonuclease subunit R [Chitinophagaceae bacterium]
MKLQFKEQDFQLQAVRSVVDCFVGQPVKKNSFTLEKSRELLRKAQLAAAGAVELELEVETAIGYRNAPLEISESVVLKNVQEVQRCNDVHQSSKIERPAGTRNGYNLTIEMETGTGKTYTYIRTMYELHKQYGWSKFIIIVPSIAIREGVFKSFEVTREHFQQAYGHQISPFIYNSGRPQDIENFASDSRISVMIINTQAFNATGADARRISQELDQFGSRKPIEIIAQTQPIIIIDEPQSVDGDKTLQKMQEFNPLFTLRYSATHKNDYNKVFRLDALDAYHRKLVKKIQVKGISLKGGGTADGYLYLESIALSTAKPPLALVEYEKRDKAGNVKRVREKLEQGANLFERSGGIPAYKNQTVQQIDGYHNKIVVGGRDIFAGELINDCNEADFRRVQIRETILSHLQKEKELFSRGVKVLSLFFIDAVEKYRQYDEAGEQQPGEYARIFEEEYNKVRHQFLDLFEQEWNEYLRDTDPSKAHKGYVPDDFAQYLQRDDAARVHQGYFAVDKKGRSVDPTVKRNSEDSDDPSAYDLIMKDKERLLSFEEPTRFIFSHSALKEGWDNPNVFQITALKAAEGGSGTRRRQEVGRGMRLCVDRNGQRLDYDSVGDAVHEINRLTVVASESYESFAKGLQQEIAATLKNRPQKASVPYFDGRIVKDAEGREHRITDDEAVKLNKFLYKQDVLDDDDRLTDAGRALIESGTVPLPSNMEPFRADLVGLLQGIYTESAFAPGNDRDTQPVSPNKNLDRQEFQELWARINLKTVYEVRFDTPKLVEQSRDLINAQLHIADRSYEVKSGELQEGSLEQLRQGGLFKDGRKNYSKVESPSTSEALYDIVGELEARTHLTRRSVVAILQAIKEEKFLLLRKDPEAFIAQCSRFINEVKASLIMNNIVYHKTEERYDAKTVFSNDKNMLRQQEPLRKHIYDYLSSDSKVEAEFARDLENSTEVVVYAKLPKSFFVATPIANYSPDWAIVLDNGHVRNIYFIAETKGSDSDMDLKEIEKLKIHCAEKHFETISGGVVKFTRVSSYDRLRALFETK